MHLTECLLRGAAPFKKFTNYKDYGFKHKISRIPALKDQIRSQQLQTGEAAPCVNKMALMMDCWKRADFNTGRCAKETAEFMACLEEAKQKQAEAKARVAKGLPVQGSNLRPSKQVNHMLASYPQPESNLKFLLSAKEKKLADEYGYGSHVYAGPKRKVGRRKMYPNFHGPSKLAP